MIKEYREEKNKLSYYLPWLSLVDKGIVLNKNGTLQKSYRYRGADLDSITIYELSNLNSQLNNIIKRLDNNWTIHIEAKRSKSKFYEKGNFPNLSGKIIDEEREIFFNKGNHYESEYYLTITQLLPSDLQKKMNGFLIEKQQQEKKDEFLEQLVEFKKKNREILNLFQSVFLEIKELSDEETYTYLHSTVSEKKDMEVKIPSVPMYMANYLADTRIIGGLKPQLGKNHFRAISILGFPQYTHSSFFDRLNKLDIEYRWVTRFISLGKQEALSILKKKWNSTFQGRISMFQRLMNEFSPNPNSAHKEDHNALENAEDIQSQINLIRGDYLSQGYYTCTILVEDENIDLVEKKAEKIAKEINNLGFTTILETANTMECFLGATPGNIHNNLRKPLLNSVTLSHLIPTSSVWSGNKFNEHLDDIPLLYTETVGSTPFRFNLHVGEIGHTSIVGPTGSGKSVLLGIISSSFQKYKNSQVYFFDKDGSSRVLTYSVGGDFYDLGQDSLSFQPLGEIDKSFDLEWANEWLIDIFIQENVTLTPLQKQKIYKALKLLSKMPKEMRTLTGFCNLLTDLKLQEALGSYLIDGALGKYFDNDFDNLKDGKWQVFEMAKIIDNKQVIVPLLNYLFYKIEAKMDGSPTIIILDECWMFFDNPIFSAKIREWLKVLRKKNTSVIFATQELGDIMNSPLFTTILDACNTKIFLPNSNAVSENYIPVYKAFGLNEKEIEIISKSTPKKEYYTKSQLGSRKFELSLGEKTLKLIASASVEKQKLAIDLMKSSDSEDEFTKKWLEII
ncbi:ATPase [Psychrilyobacter sp.]|uniref:VirB4 family type IV secretion/conjugal transfer ATPase n=1 Tax=Psychrilyobacter sp. TaxID=2586924 RepID=UPI003018EB5B